MKNAFCDLSEDEIAQVPNRYKGFLLTPFQFAQRFGFVMVSPDNFKALIDIVAEAAVAATPAPNEVLPAPTDGQVLIRRRPREPGEPVLAVQFLGDPKVHPGIFRDDTTRHSSYRVARDEDRGSLYLEHGSWIIGQGASTQVIPPNEFAREWQVVPTTSEVAPAAQEGSQ